MELCQWHYLIRQSHVNGPECNRMYRGIGRAGVPQVMSTYSKIADLWMADLARSGSQEWDEGYGSLQDAARMLSSLRMHGCSFECVAVTVCCGPDQAESAKGSSGFMGFEIANYVGEAVLAPEFVDGAVSIVGVSASSWCVQDLCKRYCRQCLNKHGLLEHWEDAHAILSVVQYLRDQDGDKNYWCDLQVMGLRSAEP